MANVCFRIRSKKNDKTPQQIYLVYRFPERKLVFPLKVRIPVKFWNSKAQRAKETIEFKDYLKVNNFLHNLKKEVESFRLEANTQCADFTPEVLSAFLVSYLKTPEEKNQPDDTQNFLLYCENIFMPMNQERIIKRTGKKVDSKTILRYKNGINQLKDFREHRGKEIYFKDIDHNFFDEFINYLTNVKKYAVNTIGKNTALVKFMISEAAKLDFPVNMSIITNPVSAMNEEADNVYLSEPELQKIYTLELSDNKRLDRARDIFILACFTGLRFSDVTNIKAENIAGDFIDLRTQKTNTRVVIPIHKTVKEVIAKYNGLLDFTISNQKMNDYIKEICQLAGLNTKTSKTQTKAGKINTQFFEKWELVSTHTARRTFATINYNKGYPLKSIMDVTGHKTEKAFFKYIKTSKEESARRLKKAWDNEGK